MLKKFSPTNPVRTHRLIGLLLGVSSFLIFSLCYSAYVYGIVSLALFAVASLIRCEVKNTFVSFTAGLLWTTVVMAYLLLSPIYELCGDLIGQAIKMYSSTASFAINGLLLLSGMALLFVLIGRWRLSVCIVSAIAHTLVFINGYIFRFRGKELIFPDLFSTATALNVADQYSLEMPQDTFFSLTVLVLILYICCCFIPQKRPASWKKRLLVLILTVAMVSKFHDCTKNMKIFIWDKGGTVINGYYVNFFISIRDFYIKAPESYAKETIQNIETEYAEASESAISGDMPNIIVIMSEAFADLRIFDREIQTNIPVTPFMDSLQENTIRGYALSSVFGGNTANSEFEFLSGFSMQYFPSGSIPYQQYILQKTPSLAWVLSEYGYECSSTHPYLSSGWNRPAVYPRLGFSESTFIEDYPNENLIRGMISDQEMYEYIVANLSSSSDAPQFIFGITMQNHGSYWSSGEPETLSVQLEDYAGEYPETEVYLSLLNQSDQALNYLISELENAPRDTILLYFGDHLPSIEPSFYEELNGGPFHSLESQMLRYTVPFFIWANYDIPESTVERTSLNYLGRYLLEASRIALPPYYQFLKEMETVVPAVNAMGYYSQDAQGYLSIDQAQGAEATWLEKYSILQYNGMQDKNNRSRFLFGYAEANK